MKKVTMIVALLVLRSLQAEARPDGATILACATLVPEHGSNMAAGHPFPYKVDISELALSKSGYGYKAGGSYGSKFYIIIN